MDPFTRMLIRLVEVYRNPPSRTWMIIFAVVVVAGVSLALVERYVGWPDWARTEPVPIRRI
jgi:hypothetical protein